MSYTPGPWHVARWGSRGLPHIRNADGIYVMDAPPRNGSKRAEVRQMDDARLISAAPDLLEALQELDARLRACANDPISAAEAYDSFYQEMVSDALTKATGVARP